MNIQTQNNNHYSPNNNFNPNPENNYHPSEPQTLHHNPVDLHNHYNPHNSEHENNYHPSNHVHSQPELNNYNPSNHHGPHNNFNNDHPSNHHGPHNNFNNDHPSNHQNSHPVFHENHPSNSYNPHFQNNNNNNNFSNNHNNLPNNFNNNNNNFNTCDDNQFQQPLYHDDNQFNPKNNNCQNFNPDDWNNTNDSNNDDYEVFDLKDSNVRLNFIKKVYCILTVQMMLTTGVVACALVYPEYDKFAQQNMWLLWTSLALNLISMYALVYSRTAARTVPYNYILLFIFTITESYMVSLITLKYDPQTVLIAAGLTVALFLGLTFYACVTKTDFTICGGLLFSMLLVLIFASIFSLIFKSRQLEIIISAISLVIFSIYIIYDTQLIVGNGEIQLEIDEYVFAAMNLYIDIIQIFLEILKLLGDSN